MIYTLGESLLDVIIESPDKVSSRPGGAMLNVAISLARANITVSLISELGDDLTSGFIIDFLANNEVNTCFVKKYDNGKTSLALAFLDEQKKPSYTFYKSYPEKRRLLCPVNFTTGDILMFGSLYSLDTSIRNELKAILIAAKRAGIFICYDPNIRNRHHLEDEATKVALQENMAFADIIKGSDEDFENIFGKMPFDDYLLEVRKLNTKATLIITRGHAGIIAYSGDYKIGLAAKPVEVVSTIGAGDAFNAGMAFALHQLDLQKVKKKGLSGEEFKTLLNSGLSFSSAVCGSMDNYIDTTFVQGP